MSSCVWGWKDHSVKWWKKKYLKVHRNCITYYFLKITISQISRLDLNTFKYIVNSKAAYQHFYIRSDLNFDNSKKCRLIIHGLRTNIFGLRGRIIIQVGTICIRNLKNKKNIEFVFWTNTNKLTEYLSLIWSSKLNISDIIMK